jgi:cell fate (sporulation/competence/biofilm development) regulator YlbF (YheA/YmcA/DUF963 family)
MGYREKAYELAKSIMNTEEYKKFLNAKKEIDSNKQLSKKVSEYSKRQAEIFSIRDPQILKEKLLQLNREFSSLSSDPLVGLYFAAGKEFNAFMAKIYRIINDILDSGMR